MKAKQLNQTTDILRNIFVNSYVKPFEMHTKLTLNIEKQTIEKAKLYAAQQKLSLSKLIEAYLKSLTLDSNEQQTVSPLVTSLTGIIDATTLEKSEYQQYQEKKHA